MQIINVYNQRYESGAAFWPDVHGRIVAALMVSQLLLLGLLSTKKAAQSTPFLLALPVLTIAFSKYCKGRFEPAFVRYPLQVCRDSTCFLFKQAWQLITSIHSVSTLRLSQRLSSLFLSSRFRKQ